MNHELLKVLLASARLMEWKKMKVLESALYVLV